MGDIMDNAESGCAVAGGLLGCDMQILQGMILETTLFPLDI